MARRLASVSIFTFLFLPNVLGASIRTRHSQGQHGSNGRALYMITNEEENSVAAIKINADGLLGDGTLTSTGGAGLAAMDANGQPAVPDSLISQSALTIAGQNIFAVNAGSNTISMLAISPSNPNAMTLIGKPATLPGTFPNTIAASIKNSLVCVGMTGSKAGVSCANFDTDSGIAEMDGLRPFDLGQSDPPVGPTNTVSQVFFSEDESMLLAMVKGDPAVNKTGFLSVFPVTGAGQPQRRNYRHQKDRRPKNWVKQQQGGNKGKLSMQDVRSSPNGTAVLFGSVPIPGTNPPQIFVTDASFGAGIVSLSSSLSANLAARQPIDDQKATCWSTISSVTNTAFVTDVGVNRIIEMSINDASIVGMIDLRQQEASKDDPGLIDLRAAGEFVYALSPGNGTTEAAVSVVNVKSKELVQHAKLGQIGVGSRAMGMAVLVNSRPRDY